MDGRFEWDEDKNRANRLKHGISFEEAQAIFDGPIRTAPDLRKGYGEERYLAVGRLGEAIVVVVVFTPRGQRMRSISARKANREERRAYSEYLQT